MAIVLAVGRPQKRHRSSAISDSFVKRANKMHSRTSFACLRKGCCFRYLSDRHRPATPRPGRGALVSPTSEPKSLQFTLRRSTILKNRRPLTGSLEMWDVREAVTIRGTPLVLSGDPRSIEASPHQNVGGQSEGRNARFESV